MEELLKYLGFTTPFMYAAGAYGFFHWLDTNASDEAKAALTRTMSFKDYKNEQIASALVEVFDQIYTYPLLRWRAFGRSFLFTAVISAIWLLESLLSLPWYRVPHKEQLLLGGIIFVGLGLTIFPFNAATDYVSLFVIRRVLIRSGTKPVIGLLFGAVNGVAIVIVGWLLRGQFILFLIKTKSLIFQVFPSTAFPLTINDLLESPSLPAVIVFAWLPLFALGIFTARVLTPLSWIVGRTQWFLKEGEEHPLKAIGYVAAVVVFLGTITGRAVFGA